jgi:hypothetical protein
MIKNVTVFFLLCMKDFFFYRFEEVDKYKTSILIEFYLFFCVFVLIFCKYLENQNVRDGCETFFFPFLVSVNYQFFFYYLIIIILYKEFLKSIYFFFVC